MLFLVFSHICLQPAVSLLICRLLSACNPVSVFRTPFGVGCALSYINDDQHVFHCVDSTSLHCIVQVYTRFLLSLVKVSV